MKRTVAHSSPGPRSRAAADPADLLRRLRAVETRLETLARGDGRPEDAREALDLVRELRGQMETPPPVDAGDDDGDGESAGTAAIREPAERRYRTLFNSAGDAILMITPDFRILDANQAACERLGYDLDRLLRLHPAELCPPELRHDMEQCLRTAREGEVAMTEVELVTAAGERLAGEITIRPVEDDAERELLCVIRDTTRRVRDARALATQYALLQTLMETAPAPIFFKDTAGTYQGCNRAFEEFIGRDRSGIIGRTAADLVPPDLAREYEQHDRNLYRNPGRVIYETLVPSETEGRPPRNVQVSKATYADASGRVAGLICIIQDITERKRMEENLYASRENLERCVVNRTSELMTAYSRLAESERTYRTLYEQAAEAILLLDGEGRVLESNPAAQALLAPDGQTLPGRNLQDFVPGAPGPTRNLLAKVAELGAARGELHLRTLSGDQAFTDASFSSLGKDLLLAMLRDITGRRRMEEALVRAKISAEDANQAKSEFVANISHELRTPIAGIFGMTDMALSSQPDDAMRHCLDQIRSAAGALLDIVNDILDFSKIEARRLELRPVDFDLRERLARLREEFLPAARSKGLTLRFPEMRNPLRLRGDPGRLGQILSNLLSNAIKFTAHGSVSLDVRPLPGEAPGTLEFTVRDTGIGIPVSKMPLLFQTFTQLEPGLSRRWGGTGLGLAISKRLAELMGGTIRVESEPQVGSAFRFRAPFAPAGGPAARTEPAATRPAAGGGFEPAVEPASAEGRAPEPPTARSAPRRILLAEDNLLNQEFLTHFLKEAGHRPRVVANGIEALQALAQEPFDLVLMDVQMPEMDGLETTRRIRNHDGSAFDPHVPVVALTAYAMKGDRERLLKAGMDEYLSKPVNIPELYAVIDRLTAQSQAPRTAVSGPA